MGNKSEGYGTERKGKEILESERKGKEKEGKRKAQNT